MMTTDPLEGKLEPETRSATDWRRATALSAAISLKRIADALTGEGQNILTQPLNNYGETIGTAIQQQMIRGQRGIDY